MRHISAIALSASLLLIPAAGRAAQGTPPKSPAPPATPAAPAAPRGTIDIRGPVTSTVPVQIDLSTRDANETRERLREVLNQYPPSVREVLRIDTSLLSRPDYLATYPVLAAFLEAHPEIAHNPSFFVGQANYRDESTDPRSAGFRAMTQLGENFMVLFIVITITSGIVFLLKTRADQIRWQRAWRAQSALNSKLVDRFASSEELMTYLQSPAGKSLTELPALPQARMPRGMAAPLGRIFWSMQAGIVLCALGVGFMMVSGRFEEIGYVIYSQGAVIFAIGIGFIASAGVSLMLSKRLGLVEPQVPRYSSDTNS
jgi:hypothetical protein